MQLNTEIQEKTSQMFSTSNEQTDAKNFEKKVKNTHSCVEFNSKHFIQMIFSRKFNGFRDNSSK